MIPCAFKVHCSIFWTTILSSRPASTSKTRRTLANVRAGYAYRNGHISTQTTQRVCSNGHTEKRSGNIVIYVSRCASKRVLWACDDTCTASVTCNMQYTQVLSKKKLRSFTTLVYCCKLTTLTVPSGQRRFSRGVRQAQGRIASEPPP